LLTLDELDRLLALSARSGRGVAYLRVTLALVSLIGTGSRCKAASVAEIAQLASTHRSSVSVVLGEMEADGLICRVRHSRGLDIELNPALAWIGATAARAEAVKVWRGRLRR
jgi:DNA-binding MarR family transcriptional regulator